MVSFVSNTGVYLENTCAPPGEGISAYVILGEKYKKGEEKKEKIMME
jgi:hypothetical protein